MAQRYEIEAWVNVRARDAAEALRMVEAILASGTDSEERWVRIAGGDELEQARAAARDTQRSDGRAWANGVSQLAGDLPVSVALFETPGSDDDARDDEHTAPRTDEDSQLAGDGPGVLLHLPENPGHPPSKDDA